MKPSAPAEAAARPRIPRGGGRDALIRAVVEVIGDHGFEGATVRRIANHAGVDNGLIRHHFGGRDELIMVAARTVMEQHLAVVTATIDFAVDPEVRERLIDAFERTPQTQLFIYEATLAARRNPALRDGIVGLYDRLIDDMQASLRERGLPDSRPLARALIAAIDGLALQQLAVTPVEAISAAYERIGDLIRVVPRTPPISP